MQGSISIRSPAKVNLHLDVQAKRTDGYHSIVSLFQLIDLWDEITIRSLKEKNKCRIIGMPHIPEEKNLIFRAVEQFRSYTGIQDGIEVHVKKKIPEKAGLGGGSSNAAYSLMLLNTLFRVGLEPEEIAVLGASLGSDVPFFCRSCCAVVTGRGESVKPVPARSDLWALMVFPQAEVSTKEAYELFDRYGMSHAPLHPAEVEVRYLSNHPRDWDFYNSFLPVIRTRVEEIDKAIQLLEEFEADYVQMSGSGSACFALFTHESHADAAHERCRRHFPCEKIHLLDKIPDPVLQ